MPSSRELQDRNYKRLAWSVVVGGLLVTFLYGYQVADKHPLRTAMAALLLAGAPFTLGGLVGFVFGIPKSLESESADRRDAIAKHGWRPNTNLEQVSDWLTKILIGVGLTELQQIPSKLQDTGDYVASSLGSDASPAIVTAMLIAFSIAGFVIAYLLTKFDLGIAIDEQNGLLDELASAIVKNPNDRKAVESYMLSSLYLDAPESFERTIQSGESFLSQEGHPRPDDGDVFAYLACAYGQKYAFLKKTKAAQADSDNARAKVLINVGNAVGREPNWKAKLRQFTNPPVGSKDDDLVALKDDSDLKTLLGIE